MSESRMKRMPFRRTSRFFPWVKPSVSKGSVSIVRGEKTVGSVTLSGYHSFKTLSLYDSKSYSSMSRSWVSVTSSVIKAFIVI